MQDQVINLQSQQMDYANEMTEDMDEGFDLENLLIRLTFSKIDLCLHYYEKKRIFYFGGDEE